MSGRQGAVGPDSEPSPEPSSEQRGFDSAAVRRLLLGALGLAALAIAALVVALVVGDDGPSPVGSWTHPEEGTIDLDSAGQGSITQSSDPVEFQWSQDASTIEFRFGNEDEPAAVATLDGDTLTFRVGDFSGNEPVIFIRTDGSGETTEATVEATDVAAGSDDGQPEEEGKTAIPAGPSVQETALGELVTIDVGADLSVDETVIGGAGNWLDVRITAVNSSPFGQAKVDLFLVCGDSRATGRFLSNVNTPSPVFPIAEPVPQETTETGWVSLILPLDDDDQVIDDCRTGEIGLIIPCFTRTCLVRLPESTQEALASAR